MEETDEAGSALFQGSTAMAVDSVDPFMDFRESMEEMIRAHGVEDWEWLEEMLVWYLRMNARRIHGVIVGDLLLSLAVVAAPRSFSSGSSCVFEIEDGDESC